MFSKEVFRIGVLRKYGKSMIVFLFLFFGLLTTANSNSCIPRDHVGGNTMYVGISQVIDTVVGMITDILFGEIKFESFGYGDRVWEQGTVYKIFMSITQDARFQTVFYLCVVLLISYLGLSFSMGYSKLSTAEMVMQFLKIGFVIFFTTPSGWDFYFEHVIKNVLEASRYFNRAIIASMYNVAIEKVSSPFQPINMVFDVIIHPDTWTKMVAILFTQGFLFSSLILVVMLYCVVTTLITLGKATILYIATIMMSSLLLSIGPMFVVCILFEKTKTYFSKWVTNLLGLFFQQYLLFLGFFIFCVIIAAMLKGIFYFETCYGPLMFVKIKIIMPKFIKDIISVVSSIIRWFGGKADVKLPEYIVYIKIPIFSGQAPTASVFDLPTNIFSIASVFVVAMLFSKFIEAVTDIGTTLTDAGMSASKFSDSGLKGLNFAQDYATQKGKDWAVKAMTGAPARWALRTSGKLLDKLNNKIKQNQALGKSTGFLKALKVMGYIPGQIGRLFNGLFNSKEQIDKNDAIIKNQHKIQDIMAQKVDKLIEDGVIKDPSELTPDQKDQIIDEVKAELKKVGHSGVFDKNGNELPISDDMIDLAFNGKIKRYLDMLFIPVRTISPNLSPSNYRTGKLAKKGRWLRRQIRKVTDKL
jgi:type IV secretory pathway VirB6-like protein